MDLQWLIPLGTFLGIIGGGVGWWFNRIDKKREKREADVIQTLKDRIEELKKAVAALTRKLSRRTRTGDKWREQLIENHIKPDPSEWPKDDDDDE